MIRDAVEQDVAVILDIFNYNIVNSTGIYLYEEQTLEQRLNWFYSKKQAGEPVFVYEEAGIVMGYAAYGPFRPYAANKYTVEHSVYVHQDHHQKGIGTQLMNAIIDYAKNHDVKTMIGCIDASNVGSIRAHEKLGFAYSGTIRNVGYKFGQWLDLALYQLDLDGPAEPKDQ